MSTSETLHAVTDDLRLRARRLGQRGDYRLRIVLLLVLLACVAWVALDSGPPKPVQQRMVLAALEGNVVRQPPSLPATITSRSYAISSEGGGAIQVAIAAALLIDDALEPRRLRCTVTPEVVNMARAGIADLEFGLNYLDAAGSKVASSIHGLRMLGRGEARRLDFARLSAPSCEGLRAELTVSFCRSDDGADCGGKTLGTAFGSIPVAAMALNYKE